MAYMKDKQGRRLDSFAVSGATQAMQDTIGKIKMGVRDVNILIVGDSTAAADTTTVGIPLGSWAYRMQAKLAALFPTHTVDFRQFNNGSPGSYGAATTIAGSGARKITIWNGAVAGKTWEYFLDATRAEVMLAGPKADLILINNGHNDDMPALQAGTDAAPKSKAYLAIEQIRLLSPDSAVVLMSQNAVAGAYPLASQYRADMYRLMARRRGWGFIDVCAAFDNDPRPLSELLSADNLHPSDAGYELWANEVIKHFNTEATSQQIPALPPSFTQYSRNYVKNAGFDDFASPPTLGNWTATNATLSKNATIFETGTYSLNIKKAAVGESYIEQLLSAANVRGKTITFLARVFASSGFPGSLGQLSIRHDGASANSAVWTQYDQWYWRSVTIRFPLNAANPYVRIITDVNAAGSQLSELRVDRVAVIQGEVPADFDFTSL